MAYKAGHFYFPTSAGAYDLALPFDPQGCVFFGGNQAVEDGIQSGGTPGLFFGMVWKTIATEAVDYQAIANSTFGVRWQHKPITCLTVGSTVDYEAASAILGAEKITLNVTTPATGSRLIHYLAWGEFDGANGASITPGTHDFLAMGYRAFTALMFNMFSSGSSRDGANAGANYFTMGVSNWPEDPDFNDTLNNNAEAITFRTTTSLGLIGYTQQFVNFSDTAIAIGMHSSVAGSFLSDIEHFQPWPTHLSEGVRAQIFGNPNRSSVAWWSGEGSSHFVTAPGVGAEQRVTPRANVEAPEACLFFGTGGRGEEQFLTPYVSYHFGVLTEDYQGCVAFDTGAGGAPSDGTPYFFQSKQYCLANSLHAGGARIAEGSFDGDQVVLTGVEASNPSSGPSIIQIYGPQVDAPSMYVMDV